MYLLRLGKLCLIWYYDNRGLPGSGRKKVVGGLKNHFKMYWGISYVNTIEIVLS